METYRIAFLGIILTLLIACIYIYKSYSKIKKLHNNLLNQVSGDEKKIELLETIISEKEKNINEYEKLARLVIQSPNGIMVMDAEGNVLWVNQGFTNMYEYNYKEFIAARGGNIRKTSFNPLVQERLNRLERTKKPVMYEAINVTRTGKNLWTQTALVPILDENGKIDGMVTIDSDIHKRVTISDNLIEKLEGINHKIDHMSSQFENLVIHTNSLFDSINESKEMIGQTDQIIKFVKEVSDKTKILGINAAIEANIAGKAGNGFRVIAGEIVDISHKTVNSVQKIVGLLNSVSNKQDQLIKEKAISENTISEHEKLIKLLKIEIGEIEKAIADLKSLN
jgi:PAS domain S-box-containing protein